MEIHALRNRGCGAVLSRFTLIHSIDSRSMKISECLLQTLEHNGVSHIFGNPGTTELPLLKACEQRKKLKYVVALPDVSAVPKADGYNG